MDTAQVVEWGMMLAAKIGVVLKLRRDEEKLGDGQRQKSEAAGVLAENPAAPRPYTLIE